MAEIESGAKWWLRYVLVPLLASAGVVGIVSQVINRPGPAPSPAAPISSTAASPTTAEQPTTAQSYPAPSSTTGKTPGSIVEHSASSSLSLPTKPQPGGTETEKLPTTAKRSSHPTKVFAEVYLLENGEKLNESKVVPAGTVITVGWDATVSQMFQPGAQLFLIRKTAWRYNEGKVIDSLPVPSRGTKAFIVQYPSEYIDLVEMVDGKSNSLVFSPVHIAGTN